MSSRRLSASARRGRRRGASSSSERSRISCAASGNGRRRAVHPRLSAALGLRGRRARDLGPGGVRGAGRAALGGRARGAGIAPMRRGDVWWADNPPPMGRRPVVLLSRDEAYAIRDFIMAAPVTTRVRRIVAEVPLGPEDGLPRPCAPTSTPSRRSRRPACSGGWPSCRRPSCLRSRRPSASRSGCERKLLSPLEAAVERVGGTLDGRCRHPIELPNSRGWCRAGLEMGPPRSSGGDSGTCRATLIADRPVRHADAHT